MLNIVPVRVSLANQDIAALLAEMEEAVAVNELAGCGCGCGCDCSDEAEPEPEPASVIGICVLDPQSIVSSILGTVASYTCLDGRTVQGYFGPGENVPGIVRDPGPGVDFFGV